MIKFSRASSEACNMKRAECDAPRFIYNEVVTKVYPSMYDYVMSPAYVLK